MQDVFSKYTQCVIGIAGIEGRQPRPYTLHEAKDSYFTVFDSVTKGVVHIPYRGIIQVIESNDGVVLRGFWGNKREKYQLLVRVAAWFTGRSEGLA